MVGWVVLRSVMSVLLVFVVLIIGPGAAALAATPSWQPPPVDMTALPGDGPPGPPARLPTYTQKTACAVLMFNIAWAAGSSGSAMPWWCGTRQAVFWVYVVPAGGPGGPSPGARYVDRRWLPGRRRGRARPCRVR